MTSKLGIAERNKKIGVPYFVANFMQILKHFEYLKTVLIEGSSKNFGET